MGSGDAGGFLLFAASRAVRGLRCRGCRQKSQVIAPEITRMVKLLEEISSSPPANENALHLNFSRPSCFAKRVTPRATRKPISQVVSARRRHGDGRGSPSTANKGLRRSLKV